MQKGVSLYLAVFVTIALLAIVLGLSTIIVTQIKIIRGMEDSVIAFQAADTGIERVLYEGSNVNPGDPGDTFSESLDNGAAFEAIVYSTTSDKCPDDVTNFCINSRGTYKETQRAIQVTR